MSKKNIVLTGGHAATTAMATIEQLEKLVPKGTVIHWIGVRKAVEGKQAITLEARIFPEMGVRFHGLITGRIQPKFTRHSLISLCKIPVGFVQTLFILLKLRPSVVLSFGGFASFPVVFWSHFLRFPVVIHEQTSVIGTANKFSARFADVIAISRESSRAYFKHKRVCLTGNPILASIVEVKMKTKLSNPPVLLIMGGSRGATRVNALVSPILPKILADYKVIHLTGEFDYQRLLTYKLTLPVNLKSRYQVLEWIRPQEMYKLYAQAEIAISRAGANTVSELVSCAVPTIFIPIPWARYDEQKKNAEFASYAGLATILEEKNASPEVLYQYLKKITANWTIRVGKLDNRLVNIDHDAAKNLAELVIEFF